MKRRSAELIAAFCFLVSFAAGAAFVAAYVLAWGPQALGGIMATGFAGLGLGLLIWSGKLLPRGEYVEAREPLEPALGAQTAFVAAAERGGGGSPKLVRRTLVLSLFGLFAAAVVPLRSLIPSQSQVPADALARTKWRGGRKRMVTKDGKLIKASDVAAGTEITGFPEGHTGSDAYYATAVLLRLPPGDVAVLPPSIRRHTAQGLIAFSKLCTHAGCPVGLYEQSSHELFCPCHQSVFNVLEGATAIAGPASRPLPQLPLAVDAQGYVVGTGDFLGQPGPTFWKTYWRPYRVRGSS